MLPERRLADAAVYGGVSLFVAVLIIELGSGRVDPSEIVLAGAFVGALLGTVSDRLVRRWWPLGTTTLYKASTAQLDDLKTLRDRAQQSAAVALAIGAGLVAGMLAPGAPRELPTFALGTSIGVGAAAILLCLAWAELKQGVAMEQSMVLALSVPATGQSAESSGDKGDLTPAHGASNHPGGTRKGATRTEVAKGAAVTVLSLAILAAVLLALLGTSTEAAKASAIATAVLVALTALYVSETSRIARSTERQADAARQALDAARSQSKSGEATVREMRRQALLGQLALLRVERPVPALDLPGGKLETTMTLTNHTSVPALFVRVGLHFYKDQCPPPVRSPFPSKSQSSPVAVTTTSRCASTPRTCARCRRGQAAFKRAWGTITVPIRCSSV